MIYLDLFSPHQSWLNKCAMCCRCLSLDGGGVKGLVLIVLLRAVLQQANNVPFPALFDWVAGTSTGAVLALALANGRSVEYCLRRVYISLSI